MRTLVSLPEVMWYLLFISAGFLLLICIFTIIVHFVQKRDETNKYGKDDFEESLPKK